MTVVAWPVFLLSAVHDILAALASSKQHLLKLIKLAVPLVVIVCHYLKSMKIAD